MAKQQTQKKAVEAPVAETKEATTVKEVKAEEKVVAKAPKKEAPKKAFDPKTVSQSTKAVSFQWSKGKKSGTKETMSENVAEIMEHKGLGKKVK